MSERRIINLDELSYKERRLGKRYVSWTSGRVGPKVGSHGLGFGVFVVAPGMSAGPAHRHHVRDELFFVIAGEGITKLDGQSFPIRAGDFIAAPAGKEAHQIINTGKHELRYIAVSAENPVDIIEYPESGKIAVGAGFEDGDPSKATIDLVGRLEPTDLPWLEDEA